MIFTIISAAAQTSSHVPGPLTTEKFMEEYEMKLEQIEQVLEVVKTGTFSQAARNLYMAQSNLSSSIKQLEDELNCKLLIRTKDGVVPTEEGKYLLEHMMMIQSRYQLLKDYTKNREPARLSLRIATTNLSRMIPYFIQISKKYMGSPINFSLCNCETLGDVIEKVATCQADFALIGAMEPYMKNIISTLRSSHIEYHPFSTADVYAIVGPENPFYEKTSPISMEDLSSQTLITFGNAAEDPTSAMFEATQSRIHSFGKISVNNCYLFYETVSTTPAMGLISCRRAAFFQNKTWPNLRLLEIENFPVRSESGWIKLQRMPLSDIASEFLQDLSPIF